MHDGRPMVADFGIALAVSAAAGGRMTETGLSLGTPHYMSPEQATADKQITARSDIYSLASVLYEMLTGQPPHLGGSAQQIIMKIIAEPVAAVTSLRKSVPPNVAATLSKALEKLPADRFATAKAFAEALADPSFTSASAAAGGSPGIPSHHRTALVAVSVFAAIVTIMAAWGWLRSRNGGMERDAVEFYLDPPDSNAAFISFAVSPDGRRLVADVATGHGQALYQRTLDARDWRVIPGTEGAGNPRFVGAVKPTFPFFSPDGEWLGYAGRDGTLKRIPVDGGTAQTIAPIPRGLAGAFWAQDNTIVFSATRTLFRVSADGGVPVRLAALDSVPGWHVLPQQSRDGRVLFFENLGDSRQPELVALSLASGRVVRLVPGMSPFAAREGWLVYATQDGLIMSRRFNPRALAFEGSPRRLAEGVAVISGAFGGAFASYAVSPGGNLVYQTGWVEGSQLVLVDRKGNARPFGERLPVALPRFSPSGDRVAFIRVAAGYEQGDVWVYSFANGTAQRLSHEGPASDPAWSRDGREVGYSAIGEADSGSAKLFRRAADATGSAELLVSSDADLWQMAFVPGDREIVCLSGNDLFRFRIGSDSQPLPLLQTTAFESQPAVSPDGRWLAYLSNETGTREVYVRSYPDMGPPTVVSVGGGNYPAWPADGTELFYWGHGQLIVAALRQGKDRTEVVGRTELFPTAPFQQSINRNYDVRPNGREFVMVRGAQGVRAVVRLGALAGESP
ncbi:MAG TPA: protein kinase [Candidatus Polarisedimenticolia bacterium]|nr:protein kinase [Candidatus Polarisedimenticolia bacterium]